MVVQRLADRERDPGRRPDHDEFCLQEFGRDHVHFDHPCHHRDKWRDLLGGREQCLWCGYQQRGDVDNAGTVLQPAGSLERLQQQMAVLYTQ